MRLSRRRMAENASRRNIALLALMPCLVSACLRGPRRIDDVLIYFCDDGTIEYIPDRDRDKSPAYMPCTSGEPPVDCDDSDPTIGSPILAYPDNDGDGFGLESAEPVPICVADDRDLDGYALEAGDCDDGDPAVHPDADEACDGLDNDCDGDIDEGFDADGDGFTSCGTTAPPDCDDSDESIHPGALEVPRNDLDDDCDGEVDETDARLASNRPGPRLKGEPNR